MIIKDFVLCSSILNVFGNQTDFAEVKTKTLPFFPFSILEQETKVSQVG